METLLSSAAPTSCLIKVLIKKQQQELWEAPLRGFSVHCLAQGAAGRKLQFGRLLPTPCLPLALPLTTQPLSHQAWH